MSMLNNIGQSVAMDGLISKSSVDPVNNAGNNAKAKEINSEAAEVAQNFAKDYEEVKEQISQIQKLSEFIGRKLEFNVNKELDTVVVKIVDPSTKQVIKEIPSEEIQNLQMRLRENINFLVDEKV